MNNGHASKSAATVARDSAFRRPHQQAEDTDHETTLGQDFGMLQASVGNRAASRLLGGGAPLENYLRSDMEARFGTDFENVRIHDDSLAHRSAGALGAKAYTYANHIVFGVRRFAPASVEGRRLLAHELAHVVQQRRGGGTIPSWDGSGPLEASASQAAQGIMAGDASVAVSGASAVGVACEPEVGKKPKKNTQGGSRKTGRNKQGDSGGSSNPQKKKYSRASDKLPDLDDPGRLDDYHAVLAQRGFESSLGVSQHSYPRKEGEAGPELDESLGLYGRIAKHRAVSEAKNKRNIDQRLAIPREELERIGGRIDAKAREADKLRRRNRTKASLTDAERSRLDQLSLDLERDRARRDAIRSFVKRQEGRTTGKALDKAAARQRISSFSDPSKPGHASKGGMLGSPGDTHVVIRVVDSVTGRTVARAYGKFEGADRSRDANFKKHAEQNALPEVERQLEAQGLFRRGTKNDLHGYRIEVVGDREVCEHTCEPYLRRFAERHNLDRIDGFTFVATTPKGRPLGDKKSATLASAASMEGSSLRPQHIAIYQRPENRNEGGQEHKPAPRPAPNSAARKMPQVALKPASKPVSRKAPAKKNDSKTPRSGALPAPRKPGKPTGAQLPGLAARPDSRTRKPESKEDTSKDFSSPPGKSKLPSSAKPKLKTSIATGSYFNDQVRINVDEYVGEAKPFRVTTTFTLTVGTELGIQGQGSPTSGGPEASGGLNVGASGTLTVSSTKAMTAAEKDQYLADVAAGRGGTSRELTIVELIAKGRAQEAAAAVRQAQTMMNDRLKGDVGDVQEFGLEGNVSIGASAGAQGKKGMGASAGGTVQFSSGKAIRRTGTRLADGRELYTISIIDLSSQSIGASGGYGVASIGYNDARWQTEARSVSFAIDPNAADYAQRKVEIFSATTEDELDAIAGQHRNLYFGRGKIRDKSKVGTTSVGLFGVGIDIDQGQFDEESESEDPGGRTYTMRGGASTGGSFTVLGRRVNPSSKTDTFGATIEQDNRATGYAQSENRNVDFGKTARNLRQSFEDAPLATAYGIVRGNKEVLKENVDTKGVDLSDNSFEVIAKKAEDKHEWDNAWDLRGISRGAGADWEATRQAVLAANHDRRKIAAALKAWEKGDSGRSGDIARLAGDTGVGFEFPDAIASERAIYDQLVFADPIPGALDAGDATAVSRRLHAISDRLVKLEKAIGDHVTEIEPKTFVEMSRRIGARKKSVRVELFKVASRPTKGLEDMTPVTSAKKAGTAVEAPRRQDSPAPATDSDTAAAKQKDSAFEAEERKNEAEDIMRRVTKYKVTEASVFANMDKELNSFWGASTIKLINEERRIRFAYKDWDKDIARLRELVKEAGGDVSSVDRYAPNRQRYLELDRKIPYHSYGSGLPGYEATE